MTDKYTSIVEQTLIDAIRVLKVRLSAIGSTDKTKTEIIDRVLAELVSELEQYRQGTNMKTVTIFEDRNHELTLELTKNKSSSLLDELELYAYTDDGNHTTSNTTVLSVNKAKELIELLTEFVKDNQ